MNKGLNGIDALVFGGGMYNLGRSSDSSGALLVSSLVILIGLILIFVSFRKDLKSAK